MENRKEFAILECVGAEGINIPKRIYVKRILEPFFRNEGWNVTGVARIKDKGILVLIENEGFSKELDRTIAKFYQFVKENEEKFFQEDEELRFASRYVGCGIRIIAAMGITDKDKAKGTDKEIFTSYIARENIEALSRELEKIKKELEDFGDKLKNF